MRSTVIPDIAISAIQGATINESGVKLQGQLSRADYQKVNKVLEACGCKWNRKTQQHDFKDRSARDKILIARESGLYVNEKDAFDFFQTPESIADEMAELLRPSICREYHGVKMVLDPSAGHGQLLKSVEKLYYVATHAIELNPSCIEALKKKNYHVTEADFLSLSPQPPPGYTGLREYTAIIMNPPFSNGKDVEHVIHAMKFLRSGGRLAAIVSPGYTFREGKKWDAFRAMLEQNEVLIEKELPAGTFKESGTMVRTVMLVIEKG